MSARTPSASTAPGDAFDGGRLLAALGALLLLISLFLTWWEPDIGDDGISAWGAFEVVDLILAGLAIAVIVRAVEMVLRPGPSRIPQGLIVAAGPVALLLILVNLIDDPPVVAADSSMEVGLWLALAGAVLMILGGLLRFARVSINVTPREPGAPGERTEPLSRDPDRPAR